MNIQDYIAPHSKDSQRIHYAAADDQLRSTHFEPRRTTANTSSALSSIPEYGPVIPSVTAQDVSPTTSMGPEPAASLDPSLLFARHDKRKSSPAVLGLPYGLSDQGQLESYLSQQRNSIEAAMLLANFNRLPTTTATSKAESKST